MGESGCQLLKKIIKKKNKKQKVKRVPDQPHKNESIHLYLLKIKR